MSPTAALPALFQPVQVGNITLSNRVVLAPLTRFRVTDAHIPGPLAAEYYAQRASAPGTLLVTEATLIAPQAGGYANVPGIWNDEQIEGWKKVTDAVHAKKSFIFLQLWDLGRVADPAVLKAEGDFDLVGASPIALEDHATPRELTVDEIRTHVELFGIAASNAVHKAGFDGVEIHGANGYLVDQFLQDVTNQRTDEYGGSPENRTRFALEIVSEVARAVGASKTGLRLSPWNHFQSMGMADPKPTFSTLVSALVSALPDLAYLHVVDARSDGMEVLDDAQLPAERSNDFIRNLWTPRPLISAGGFTRKTALEAAEKNGDLIAFGRAFIANPDLVERLIRDIPLTKGNRETYYLPANFTPLGYTDYPFATQKVVEEVESHL